GGGSRARSRERGTDTPPLAYRYRYDAGRERGSRPPSSPETRAQASPVLSWEWIGFPCRPRTRRSSCAGGLARLPLPPPAAQQGPFLALHADDLLRHGPQLRAVRLRRRQARERHAALQVRGHHRDVGALERPALEAAQLLDRRSGYTDRALRGRRAGLAPPRDHTPALGV